VTVDAGRKPLAGLRILELTHAVAGPVAGFILGDMGAEVIKVEAPNARHKNAPADAPPVSGAPDHPYNRVNLWTEMNRSKASFVLDLTRPEGHAIIVQLAEKCDAVIENFSPRVIRNLDLSYERLSEANPKIVLVSMPAFGKSGPYADRRAYGPGVDAMSGLSHLTGYAGGAPLKPGNFYCDYNAGMLAALALLSAVRHARRTGQGQYVEVAMIEGEIQLVGDAMMDYFMNGRERQRAGNRDSDMAPHGAYRSSGEDHWVTIACRNDEDFARLCATIGHPELVGDQAFNTLSARKLREDTLDLIIGAWTRRRTNVEAMEALQAAGVPAGAALGVDELTRNEHVQARKVFQTVQHPEIGPHPHSRVAWQFSDTPAVIEKPAPLFGQDNDYVLGELLGLSSEEIDRLEDLGVTGREPI
jgi:crotonobetainyl-CoA:carnitine CoA-transferase CaiB-like acyl-CoA transferase